MWPGPIVTAGKPTCAPLAASCGACRWRKSPFEVPTFHRLLRSAASALLPISNGVPAVYCGPRPASAASTSDRNDERRISRHDS